MLLNLSLLDIYMFVFAEYLLRHGSRLQDDSSIRLQFNYCDAEVFKDFVIMFHDKSHKIHIGEATKMGAIEAGIWMEEDQIKKEILSEVIHSFLCFRSLESILDDKNLDFVWVKTEINRYCKKRVILCMYHSNLFTMFVPLLFSGTASRTCRPI